MRTQASIQSKLRQDLSDSTTLLHKLSTKTKIWFGCDKVQAFFIRLTTPAQARYGHFPMAAHSGQSMQTMLEGECLLLLRCVCNCGTLHSRPIARLQKHRTNLSSVRAQGHQMGNASVTPLDSGQLHDSICPSKQISAKPPSEQAFRKD